MYGALEACCRCRDVEEFARRGLEIRCRRVDVEVWRSGDALQACCLYEVWRSGALSAWCRCRDVEEFAPRALEMRCRRVDVET